MAAVDRYVNGVHKQTKYFATWLPAAPIALGDVGIMDGRVFRKVTSLAGRGITFKENPAPSPLADYDFTENEGGSLTIKAAGEAAPPGSTLGTAEAGAAVSFSREGAFVFQAKGCAERSIADLVQLGWDVLTELQSGWDHEWVVVDTVVTARCGTMLISEGRTSGLDLSAKVDAIPSGSARLANASAQLSVKNQRGSVAKCVAEENLTPLYRVSKVRSGILSWLTGRYDFRPVKGAPNLEAMRRLPEAPTPGDRVLERIEPAPLETWE